MATAARATSSKPARGLLSIGQVLAKVSPDFPDLTPSKLRFLEEQGLITPARTPSGYRKFSAEDVDRLRLILTMQRDHYLPLRVIREHLAEIASGGTPALPNAQGLTADSLLSSPTRYSRDEFVRACGASSNLLHDAVSAGMLEPADSYAEEHIIVLTALVELQRSGIEPRHLRTMRQAAEREFSLIERALVPVSHRQEASSKARSNERAHEIARHIEIVRSQILRQVITQNTL
jgi:DNA-binding transcriptional MerR regulator